MNIKLESKVKLDTIDIISLEPAEGQQLDNIRMITSNYSYHNRGQEKSLWNGTDLLTRSSVISFEGIPMLPQIDKHTSCLNLNVTSITNSFRGIEILQMNHKTYSSQEFLTEVRLTLPRGITKTVECDISSIRSLMVEATIIKGIVQDECLFLPAAESNYLVVKDGASHKEYLTRIAEYLGEKTISGKNLVKGKVYKLKSSNTSRVWSLYLGSSYLVNPWSRGGTPSEKSKVYLFLTLPSPDLKEPENIAPKLIKFQFKNYLENFSEMTEDKSVPPITYATADYNPSPRLEYTTKTTLLPGKDNILDLTGILSEKQLSVLASICYLGDTEAFDIDINRLRWKTLFKTLDKASQFYDASRKGNVQTLMNLNRESLGYGNRMTPYKSTQEGITPVTI
jgi:hypothetical protein